MPPPGMGPPPGCATRSLPNLFRPVGRLRPRSKLTPPAPALPWQDAAAKAAAVGRRGMSEKTTRQRLYAPTTRRRPRRRRVSAIGPLWCPLCALSGVPPWHPPLRTGTPRVTFGLVISLEIADWLPKRGKTKGTVLLLRLLVRSRSAARRRLVGSSCGVPPFRSHLVSSLYPPAPGRNHEAMIPIQAVMCKHPRSLNPLHPRATRRAPRCQLQLVRPT